MNDRLQLTAVVREPAKIMIVDDNPSILLMMEGKMEVMGYQSISADNGLSAMAQLQQVSVDVVLCDILMPEMDGLEFLETLKADNHLRDIPVIMISALDDTEFVIRCIELGAIDFLFKPFNDRLLKVRIESVLRGRNLAEAQQTLEKRVEERTGELQTVNADLVQAKDAAEAANRAKSAFLANMSHELRTPLNAILGFTQLMVRDQTLAPEHRDNLEVVSRSGEHLLSLINDVLEISKIEAGQMVLIEESFDLYRLLDDLEGMFQLRASDKGLQLLFDGTSDIPHFVYMDQGKLRQVIINLLNNAIKFTEVGSVTLRVHTENKNKTSYLYFEIEDAGPGIAEEEQDKLFQAFSQTETGHQAQEGTGLGLSISQQFVNLMQGEITVHSEVGRGSVFAFNAAYEIAQLNDVGKKSLAIRNVIGLAPDQPTFRILIVEDKLENRKLLTRFLAPLGFDVREAENGKRGIEVWEEWKPQLIWMDMRMPVMDGYEATKHIKATTKGQATTIIALTASVFEEERAVVLSAGCDDFVRKPFKTEEVFDALHKHLGVRFIYEDEGAETRGETGGQDLIPEALSDLSSEWVSQFHGAANRADTDEMLSLLEQIQSGHATLAQDLTKRIHNFQLEELIAISEPLEKGNTDAR
ncbi:MAG TPA: hybrid sensor histidine kinase/response regulator [Verrucomicrobiales bacterium]|nr:hybrid sensor histidine kinase/response regulator [Verrucomicrobiales bacterium]